MIYIVMIYIAENLKFNIDNVYDFIVKVLRDGAQCNIPCKSSHGHDLKYNVFLVGMSKFVKLMVLPGSHS
jgi:hypothetical protein